MASINFPSFSGLRCLMMPYVQGDVNSVPEEFSAYSDILSTTYIKAGDIGFLTIDESMVEAGKPHRGARAKYARALHTEAGLRGPVYKWGGYKWGNEDLVTLERDVRVLLASNLGGTTAIWDAVVEDTTHDGDIGHLADAFPYDSASFLEAGEVAEIGILTPHESIPVQEACARQFIRIVGAGVHGREPYFTRNPLVEV